MRPHKLLAGSAALAWMLLAQPALAGTVSISSATGETSVVYEAAVGEINNVSIVEAPGNVYTITDLNAVITPQASECMSISPNAVRCQLDPDDDPVVEVRTKDGADNVDVASDRGLVDGGAGPDTLRGTRGVPDLLFGLALVGGPGDDRLVGRSGTQALYGERGADSLDGGLGKDYLEGGPGTDVLAGGPGGDTVSYGDRSAPVRISLDGRANDGAAGEHDWVRADVESADASFGPTTFIGNAGPNGFYGGDERDVVRAGAGDDFVDGLGGRDVLSGGAGDDFLNGYNGADVIRGGNGKDLLLGQRGVDDLRGGRGNDRLSGGRENDMLRGGPGHDRMSGNGGADVLYARDRNAEGVSGGPGLDRAQVDSVDELFGVEVLF